MLWMEFEPTIPVFEWAKTFHAQDCAATVVGVSYVGLCLMFMLGYFLDNWNNLSDILLSIIIAIVPENLPFEQHNVCFLSQSGPIMYASVLCKVNGLIFVDLWANFTEVSAYRLMLRYTSVTNFACHSLPPSNREKNMGFISLLFCSINFIKHYLIERCIFPRELHIRLSGAGIAPTSEVGFPHIVFLKKLKMK
jgi:hypothetical protein